RGARHRQHRARRAASASPPDRRWCRARPRRRLELRVAGAARRGGRGRRPPARGAAPPPPLPSRAGPTTPRPAGGGARARGPGRLMLGGHSYGGRQASMLLADAPGLAAGLVLLAYPLHPPGRPERRRTEHLITLRTPTVFVHGTRDPFGLPDELDEARGLMPGPTELITVRDAGHDLGARTNGAFASDAVAALLALLG